jgi:hypothetical protein
MGLCGTFCPLQLSHWGGKGMLRDAARSTSSRPIRRPALCSPSFILSRCPLNVSLEDINETCGSSYRHARTVWTAELVPDLRTSWACWCTVWTTDRLIDWFVHQLNDWPIYLSHRPLTNQQSHDWVTDSWLTDWLTDWSMDSLVSHFSDRMTRR